MKAGWLLLIGLILGLALGLVYTWVISPVEYYDTYPPLMHSDYRADWIRMTALAYGQAPDLARAQVRLRELPPDEIRQELAQALDAAVAASRPLPVLQRMATLAQLYGVESPAVAVYAGSPPIAITPEANIVPPTPTATVAPRPQPATPTLTPIVLPTVSVLPTPTPIPPPYIVLEQNSDCAPAPRIAISITQEMTITVRGRERREIHGVPGVEVWLLSAEGADRAVTGFRPAQGLGYADFTAMPGAVYHLYLEKPSGIPLASLSIATCSASGAAGWTSWLVVAQYSAAE